MHNSSQAGVKCCRRVLLVILFIVIVILLLLLLLLLLIIIIINIIIIIIIIIIIVISSSSSLPLFIHGYRVILLAISQRFIFNKSRFKETSMEQMSLTAHVRWISSGNISVCEFDRQLGKSLIYKRNNKGPSIVPWGIPQVRVQLLERKPLTAYFYMRTIV